MSTPRNGVDDADRLARVKLSSAIEPGDLRVTDLVSELGAGKVADSLAAALAAAPADHEAVELGRVLTRVEEHPWPAELSARYLGRFSAEPVPITRVAPTWVVELEADSAFEHGRWRHLTRYRRVRWDLCG
jgi:hypothetical protein